MASLLRAIRNIQVLIILALIIVYSAGTAYALMSYTSVRGLTVKMFYVSRFCASSETGRVVNFSVVASVWSTHSLKTSIKQVLFSLSVDGGQPKTQNATDSSFDPGNGASYTIRFQNTALDPGFLPSSSRIVLAVSALVSAGLWSATITTSDARDQSFQTTSC